jgi:hypothetical protein
MQYDKQIGDEKSSLENSCEVWRIKIVDKSTFSRKQDEGGVFALRKCAQSISRIKLPLYRSYREREKNFVGDWPIIWTRDVAEQVQWPEPGSSSTETKP